MKVLSTLNVSVDGFNARADGNEDFLPSEGWDEFVVDAKRCDNIVMGRETFELVMKHYPDYNFDSVDVAHKLIITSDTTYRAPDGYTVVQSPQEAVEYLEEREVETLFVIGGGKLNAAFLSLGIVDEFWLTVVPYILGTGRPMVSTDQELNIKLELISTEELPKGRVLLKYRVKN